MQIPIRRPCSIMRYRILFLLLVMTVVAVSMTLRNYAKTAAFAVVNRSGRDIRVELVNCTNHNVKKFPFVWVKNGQIYSTTIRVRQYDYTSIRINDVDQNYVRFGREMNELPFGALETYLVGPNSFQDSDSSTTGQVVSPLFRNLDGTLSPREPFK